jgi:hypothetical protein
MNWKSFIVGPNPLPSWQVKLINKLSKKSR